MPVLLLLPLPEAPGPLLCIYKALPSFKISFKVTSSLKAPQRPSVKSKLLPRTPTALHLELMDKLMLSSGSSCLSSQLMRGTVGAFCLPGI